jgi:putative intracellular protease/amidase
VKKRRADPKALFLTVCNGSLVLAQTDVLDRYHVGSNKMALKIVVDAGKLNKAVR